MNFRMHGKRDVLFREMGEDKVYAPEENSGMFSEIVRLKSTRGVFAGHDHANTFAVSIRALFWGTAHTPVLIKRTRLKTVYGQCNNHGWGWKINIKTDRISVSC